MSPPLPIPPLLVFNVFLASYRQYHGAIRIHGDFVLKVSILLSNCVNFLDFGESLKLLRRINLHVQKLVTRGTTTVAVNIGGRFDAQHDTL